MRRLEGIRLFCVREWKFLLCFLLAAYLTVSVAGFFDRSRVYVRSCSGVPIQACFN